MQVTSSASTVPASALASSSSVGASVSVTTSATPTPTLTPTPTPTPHKPDATKADLESMEIPSDCTVSADARLSNGEFHDKKNHIDVRLVGKPASVDIDGDRIKEQVSFLNCYTGGNAPLPDFLVVVGRGGRLIASKGLESLNTAAVHGFNGKTVTADGHDIRFTADITGVPMSGIAKVKGSQLIFDMDPGSWKSANFTMQGYGPAKVGSRIKNMPGARYDDSCGIVRVPGRPRNLDIVPDDSGTVIKHVGTRDPRFHTRSGAHVGMSEKQLRKIYGSALKPVIVGAQSPEDGLAISSGGHSMAFWLDYEDRHVTTIYVSDGPAGPVSFCDVGYEEDES